MYIWIGLVLEKDDENYIRVYFKLVEYYRKIDLDVANDYERFYNEIINEEE